tara:strand:+ start:1777 stop:2097 length:321 start_codon:yes stop_codon:yes gene_type:complete
MEPSQLQPPVLSGTIDKISGFILPALDRFIEIKSIKQSDGRDLSPRSLSGLPDDPNASQFQAINDEKQRRQGAANFLQIPDGLGKILVVGGVVIGVVVLSKAILKK